MDTHRPPFGEGRLREILDAVIQHGDTLENHYLEIKLEVDIRKALGKAKLAKFILGAGNRLPEIAERHFGGYALMVIGAAQGKTEGVDPGLEILDIHSAVERYVGPTGPHIELQRIRLTNGRDVLFLTVDPPRQGDLIHLCHQDFQGNKDEVAYSLKDGGIYVRKAGTTTVAKATQVEDLLRRMSKIPSLELGLNIEGLSHCFADATDFRSQYLDGRADKYRAEMSARTEKRPSILDSHTYLDPPIRTPEQVETRLRKWRAQVEADWPETEEKLFGLCGQGLRFRVSNHAESFLQQVTLTITFHHAMGVRWRDKTDAHEWLGLVDEIDPSPYDSSFASTLGPILRSDYPVRWENKDGNLVVTITLKALPPEPDWISDDDDVVLVRDRDSAGPVRVTWVATAADYGTVFRGEATVPAAEPFGVNPSQKGSEGQR